MSDMHYVILNALGMAVICLAFAGACFLIAAAFDTFITVFRRIK